MSQRIQGVDVKALDKQVKLALSGLTSEGYDLTNSTAALTVMGRLPGHIGIPTMEQVQTSMKKIIR